MTPMLASTDDWLKIITAISGVVGALAAVLAAVFHRPRQSKNKWSGREQPTAPELPVPVEPQQKTWYKDRPEIKNEWSATNPSAPPPTPPIPQGTKPVRWWKSDVHAAARPLARVRIGRK